MVVIPIVSFLFSGGMIGWASAPYDPLWERRHPHRSAWMALGGPAANFSLMLLAALGIHVGRIFHLFNNDPVTGAPNLLLVVLEITFMLNLLLGTFNLLPVPPLDGSTAIMLLMSETARRVIWTGSAATITAWPGCSLACWFSRGFPYVQTFVLHLLF
jgi:Predicted membrane-associated Zn-dependent proteases 1